MDAVGGNLLGGPGPGPSGRPVEELLTALRKGSKLRKYGRRGKPKDHYFHLSSDDRELMWESSNGKMRSIPLGLVVRLLHGQQTPVFRREPLPELEQLSFSLIYRDGPRSNAERSLDLVCKHAADFETWFWGLQLVITWAQGAGPPTVTAPPPPLLPLKRVSPALPLLGASLTPEEHQRELQALAQGLAPLASASYASFAPSRTGAAPRREIGDCFIWGKWSDIEGSDDLSPTAALQSSAVPVMVHHTHALDVTQVACGACHAALITRSGELYTWGNGAGGKLGHGSCASLPVPQQVQRLTGRGVAQVAVGHSSTAAVLADGSLYTWGSGLAGQLGYASSPSAGVWPRRVQLGPDAGVRVAAVACGPFHSAATSADGRLFTWGDGLFGKLGHGDRASSVQPRQVAALADQWVVSVSCGWWHSAAAGVPRAALPPDGGERRAPGVVPSPRASSPTCGGSVFTWGGDFSWHEPSGRSGGKPDTHCGCLGHGDLEGRLLPTLLKGEDDICQVACGLNFTVALTTHGEVLQMGRTGAGNPREHNTPWEDCLAPVIVGGKLAAMRVEAIACGTSHVVVVASLRPQVGQLLSPTTRAPPAATRVLTWGRGSHGQLGTGRAGEDHNAPQVVAALDGRRVLHLAAGGNYSMAVCEHDARAAAARLSLEGDDTPPSAPLPLSPVGAGTRHGGPPMGLSSRALRAAGIQTSPSFASSSSRGAGSGGVGDGSRPSSERAVALRPGGGAPSGLATLRVGTEPSLSSLVQLAGGSGKSRSRLGSMLSGALASSRLGSAVSGRSGGSAKALPPPLRPRSEVDLAALSTASSLNTSATSVGVLALSPSYGAALDDLEGSKPSSRPSSPRSLHREREQAASVRYLTDRASNLEAALARKQREVEALRATLGMLQHQQQQQQARGAAGGQQPLPAAGRYAATAWLHLGGGDEGSDGSAHQWEDACSSSPSASPVPGPAGILAEEAAGVSPRHARGGHSRMLSAADSLGGWAGGGGPDERTGSGAGASSSSAAAAQQPGTPGGSGGSPLARLLSEKRRGGGGSGAASFRFFGSLGRQGAAPTSAAGSSSAGVVSSAGVASNAGVISSAGADASANAPPSELAALREANRLLQEQVAALQSRMVAQERLDHPRGASGGSSGAGRGPLPRGRSTAVDVGALISTTTREVEPGVYLSLTPAEGGGYDLRRVRFSKQVFSSDEANAWWTAHAQRVMQEQGIRPPSDTGNALAAAGAAAAGGSVVAQDERVRIPPPFLLRGESPSTGLHHSPTGSLHEVDWFGAPSGAETDANPHASPSKLSIATFPRGASDADGHPSGGDGGSGVALLAHASSADAGDPSQSAPAGGHKRTPSALFRLFGGAAPP